MVKHNRWGRQTRQQGSRILHMRRPRCTAFFTRIYFRLQTLGVFPECILERRNPEGPCLRSARCCVVTSVCG